MRIAFDANREKYLFRVSAMLWWATRKNIRTIYLWWRVFHCFDWNNEIRLQFTLNKLIVPRICNEIRECELKKKMVFGSEKIILHAQWSNVMYIANKQTQIDGDNFSNNFHALNIFLGYSLSYITIHRICSLAQFKSLSAMHFCVSSFFFFAWQ